MPSTSTTGSLNIKQFDYNLDTNLCDGKFHIDLSPTVYVADGATKVLGAKVKILNNIGVPVKDYGSGYDVVPPMTSTLLVDIPKFSKGFYYGKYTVFVKLFDANGKSWEIEKDVTICDLNGKPYGILSGKMYARCSEGKVTFVLDNLPTYQGELPEDESINLLVTFPTGSGIAPKSSQVGTFSVNGFEGTYTVKGDVCAIYNYEDRVRVQVPYRVSFDKPVRCNLNECAVLESLKLLHDKVQDGCSEETKEDVGNITLDALRLFHMAKISIECGQDATEYINDLETLLNCQGGCNYGSAEGTPFGLSLPNRDVNILGCNVTKSADGLTDTYTINNFEYKVEIPDNGGILMVSTPLLANCVKTQVITFSMNALYAKLKEVALSSPAEVAFWNLDFKTQINQVDPKCLGVTKEQWAKLTTKEQIQLLVDGICAGVSCTSTIDTLTATKSGVDVLASFTNTAASKIDIYLDGTLQSEVLGSTATFLLLGKADGLAHVLKLVPICANGLTGTPKQINFNYAGCAAIQSVSLNAVSTSNVACPFDLNTLLNPVPAGLVTEWHTADSTSGATLVSNAASVMAGDYWVFYKDANGCYSPSTKVTVTCLNTVACSAPQSIQVSNVVGGGYRVSFLPAVNAPVGDQYIVKRRLYSAPNLPASYTTIGTPTYNGTTGRFEIIDGNGVNNTRYYYVAQSVCANGYRPEIGIDFVNMICPSVAITKTSSAISFSFSSVSGQIDKYEAELWDDAETVLISKVTFNAPFPTPMAGTFGQVLNSATNYKVRVTQSIGNYIHYCAFQQVKTLTGGSGTPPSTGIFQIGTDLVTLCGGETTTQIYWAAGVTLGQGVAIYSNSALTVPLSNTITRIMLSNGTVYNVTNSVLGAATGETCQSQSGCVAVIWEQSSQYMTTTCLGNAQPATQQVSRFIYKVGGVETPAPANIAIMVRLSHTNCLGFTSMETILHNIPTGQGHADFTFDAYRYVDCGGSCIEESRVPIDFQVTSNNASIC